MMNAEMTSYEKAKRQLRRVMQKQQNGISTKKLLLLGGVALLAVLGITMSGSMSGRRRLTTEKDLALVEKYYPGVTCQATPDQFRNLLEDAKKRQLQERPEAKPENTQFEVGSHVTQNGDPLCYRIVRVNRDGTYNLRIHYEITGSFYKKLGALYPAGVLPDGFPEFPYETSLEKVKEELIQPSKSSKEDRESAGKKIFAICQREYNSILTGVPNHTSVGAAPGAPKPKPVRQVTTPRASPVSRQEPRPFYSKLSDEGCEELANKLGVKNRRYWPSIQGDLWWKITNTTETYATVSVPPAILKEVNDLNDSRPEGKRIEIPSTLENSYRVPLDNIVGKREDNLASLHERRDKDNKTKVACWMLMSYF